MSDNKIRNKVDDIIYATELFGVNREELYDIVSDFTQKNTCIYGVEKALEDYIRRNYPYEQLDDDETVQDIITLILAESDRGINSDGKYWNDLPQIHLNTLFNLKGDNFWFQVQSENDPLFDQSDEVDIKIKYEDSKRGMTIKTDFTYPDTGLSTNNYPALIHHINNNILLSSNEKLILLNSRKYYWRFYLIDTGRLSFLKQRFGDNINIVGTGGLIEETSLDEYISEPTPRDRQEIVHDAEQEGEIGEVLTQQIEKESEQVPEGIAIDTPDPEQKSEMNGGVLDFEAINDAGVETPETSLDLDDDVEEVIDEAETMLDEERIENDVFKKQEQKEQGKIITDTDYKPQVTRDEVINKEDNESLQDVVQREEGGQRTQENKEEIDGLVDKIIYKLKNLF